LRKLLSGYATLSICQVSWFVAWLTLDQRRIESNRHGVTCCKIAEASKGENADVRKGFLGKKIMKFYGKQLETVWFKVGSFNV
jgi:hypothetical protein